MHGLRSLHMLGTHDMGYGCKEIWLVSAFDVLDLDIQRENCWQLSARKDRSIAFAQVVPAILWQACGDGLELVAPSMDAVSASPPAAAVIRRRPTNHTLLDTIIVCKGTCTMVQIPDPMETIEQH